MGLLQRDARHRQRLTVRPFTIGESLAFLMNERRMPGTGKATLDGRWRLAAAAERLTAAWPTSAVAGAGRFLRNLLLR